MNSMAQLCVVFYLGLDSPLRTKLFALCDFQGGYSNTGFILLPQTFGYI